MNVLEKIDAYINPLTRLGNWNYSYKLPLFVSIIACIGIEIYIHVLAKNTENLAILAIMIPIALIIYFSARDGIIGGLITTGVSILYYFYIIVTLHYVGQQYISGVTTTAVLGIMYTVLAVVIGWLRQTLDFLMEKEKKARSIAEEGKLRLQTILTQLPVGVLILDAKKNTFEANKQTEKILGRKIKKAAARESDYLSQVAYHSQHPLSQKQWPIMRAINEGKVILEEEIEFIRSDKSHAFLLVNAAPIKDVQGKTVAAVSTISDITQLKELDEKKDDFINMASHELKTPITSIKLYLDSLLATAKSQNNPVVKKMAIHMETQIKRLQKLSNDLLDVSLMQTGQLTLSRKKVRLDKLISQIIKSLQRVTTQKIIFSQKTPLILRLDPIRIEQVLSNIITNAIKYSKGKGNVTVSLGKSKERAVIKITDDGIGIAKGQQKNIFNKLYRVRENMGNTFPGFGMGLYIAREIVKSHKGDIWVESKKGKGSTFYISLPI